MKNTILLIKESLPFLKYCAIGVLGTLIDLATVFLLVEFLGFHPINASIVGFLFAVTNNFFFNKNWTFKNTSSFHGVLYLRFFLVSSVGLLITSLLMYVFWSILGIYYLLAKILISGIVLTWNFLANKFWTFHIKEHGVTVPEKFNFELSIIIPAYNEEKRIIKTIHSIKEYLNFKNINAEIIVVDDGSKDNTVEVVQSLSSLISNLKIISYKKNRGKGYAVARGIFESSGQYILFTDADNSTDINNYSILKREINENEIVIGSRYLKKSDIVKKQSNLRVLISRIGNFFIRAFIIDGIVDTQCGFKLLRHRAAKEIFCRQKIYRFGFDIEMLVIAKSLEYSVTEVPVVWSDVLGSRFSPVRDSIRVFVDIAQIKINLWIGKYI
jgi:putative flippase GtrA